MRILITGGCGFLGTNLAAFGAKNGHEITVLDNLSRVGSSQNLEWLRSQIGVGWEEVDVRDSDPLDNVITKRKPDVVFHLAAQVAMVTSIADPRADFEINVIGTHNLLESIRVNSPGTLLVYASTNKVYGDLEQYNYRETTSRYECVENPQGFDERTALSFQSPYGCSKGAADQYVIDYAHTYGLKTVVFRHSSIYGGRQFATEHQGWVAWFCREVLDRASGISREPITISGDGKQVRDVLYIDDAVTLYFSLLKIDDPISAEVFNVGGGVGRSLSLLELLTRLEEISGTKIEIRQLPPRLGDQRVFISDITKAKAMLQWEPTISVEDGITRTIEWVTEGFR